MTYLKTNNLLIFLLSLCIGLAMIVGCEGAEGPQGPAGPEGPQGEQGPQGEEGTANVIYSDWITVNSNNWTAAENFGDSLRYHDITAPELSQEIIDQGDVSVYADFIGSDFIYQLPVSEVPGFPWSLNFKIKPDTIRMEFFDPNDPDSDPGPLGDGNAFRYVLIPGGQTTGSSTKEKEENFEDMSYEELQQRFNIPDEGSGVIRDVSLR